MDRRLFTLASLFTLLALIGGLLTVADLRPGAAPEQPMLEPSDTLAAPLGQLPITFEPNQGQADGNVAFIARGADYRLDLNATNLALTVGRMALAQVRMELVGANPDVQVRGQHALPGRVNHFIGNDPGQWRTRIPTFASVVYEAVYPGVDLIVKGNQGDLEYDFVVAPGADPASVSLTFPGADAISLDPSGDLVLTVAKQTVLHRRPLIYQEIAGEQVAVAGGFAVDAAGRIGFDVARYDTSQPLVIDPVIEYSTTLSGPGEETAYDVVVDDAGNAYVSGYTTSATDFPSTTGPGHQGEWDGFVVKLNDSGGVEWATYFGGAQYEVGVSSVIDAAGNVYVAGVTNSTDFPVAVDAADPEQAAQPTNHGGFEGFVVKLDATGAVVYSTYVGGAGDDDATGIAVDDDGRAYVNGDLGSDDNFPDTTGGYRNAYQGGTTDGFVVVIAPDGSAFDYATFLGGSGREIGGGLALSAADDPIVYITGRTTSSDFSGADTGYQESLGGSTDVYVVALDPSEPVPDDQLVFATYLGGTDEDVARDIAVDGAGNIYVTGWSEALTPPPHPTQYPTTLGAYDTTHDGPWDSFVTKLAPDGSDLVYSTLLGGSIDDFTLGIAVNELGEAHVAGWTTSTDFPVVDSILVGGGHSRAGDAFLARLSSDGADLAYSSLFGGPLHDAGLRVALDATGTAYMTGTSYVTGASDADAWVKKVVPTTGDAIYVWRAPGRDGTPIDLAEAGRLADFAVAEGIGTIIYDNWGCGIDCSPAGAEHQDSATLAPIIEEFHDHGLRVEALYTDNATRNIVGDNVSRVQEVVLHNAEVAPNQRFDGIRLNIEVFDCGPQHGVAGPSLADCTDPDPASDDVVNDFDVLQGAIDDAGSLPIFMSVGHTWTNTSEILTRFDGIDVQVAQINYDDDYTSADGRAIEFLSSDEICLGYLLGKPVHVTVETWDVVNNLGMRHFNTFFDNGEDYMKTKLLELDFSASVDGRGYTPVCPEPPHGIAYHFYRASYGSPILPGWAPDADGDGVADAIDITAGGGLPSEFSHVALGGTTSGEITADGNQVMMVADALDPDDGIVITSLYDDPEDSIVRDQPATVAMNPGVGEDCTATPEPPNPTLLTIPADTQVIVTCGSLQVDVVKGDVETAFTATDGTVATTTLSEGNSVTFEPETATFVAPPDNPDPVVVIVDGEEISVEPGETVNADAAITSLTGPLAPLQTGTVVAMSATLADPQPDGTYLATWDWDDGTTSSGVVDTATGVVTGDHTYTTPGVDTVRLTVSDDQGGSDTELFEFIVAYDPDAGFVTGGGWFDSPPGALLADPDAVGKANFGYVAKYKKGQSVPDGQTEFQFKAGDLELHSTEYDWLVVTGNDTARFKGTGAINGEGQYKFQIWAYDDPDAIRIKIWSEDEAGNETIVYDTVEAIELGGGNIQVHADD